MNGTPADRPCRRLPRRRRGRRRARRRHRGLGVAARSTSTSAAGSRASSSRCATSGTAQAVLAVLEGRRPRHRRHADDARARAAPTRRSATTSTPTTSRAADRAGDRRRGDVDPRARPRGPALPPALPGREVARAEAALRPRRPARRGRRQHRQLRRRDVHRAGRDRERGRPRRRVRRGDRPDRRAPVELRPRGGGRARGRRRRGDASRGDRRHRSSRSRCGSPRTRRATAIEAVAEAARTLDGWRDGGLADAARGVRAVRLGRRALRRPAQNARIPSRLHAIEELPIALGLLVATGGDYTETMLGGVNYGRDSDSIASMGGALAGALGGRRCRATGSRRSATASKLDLEEPGRTMAEVAVEIFARGRARGYEARRGDARLRPARSPA